MGYIVIKKKAWQMMMKWQSNQYARLYLINEHTEKIINYTNNPNQKKYLLLKIGNQIIRDCNHRQN